MKISSFVMLGGVALMAAWGAQVTSQKAAEKRAAVVATYRLDDRQAEVYDGCLDALKQKALKQGGDKAEFCGCLSKSVTDAYDSPKSAVAGITLVADLAVNGGKPDAILAALKSDSNNMSRLTRLGTSMRQCAEDQRTAFASPAEMHKWCDAKSERAAKPACKVQ